MGCEHEWRAGRTIRTDDGSRWEAGACRKCGFLFEDWLGEQLSASQERERRYRELLLDTLQQCSDMGPTVLLMEIRQAIASADAPAAPMPPGLTLTAEEANEASYLVDLAVTILIERGAPYSPAQVGAIARKLRACAAASRGETGAETRAARMERAWQKHQRGELVTLDEFPEVRADAALRSSADAPGDPCDAHDSTAPAPCATCGGSRQVPAHCPSPRYEPYCTTKHMEPCPACAKGTGNDPHAT